MRNWKKIEIKRITRTKKERLEVKKALQVKKAIIEKREENIAGRRKSFISKNVTPHHHRKLSIKSIHYKRTFFVCVFQNIIKIKQHLLTKLIVLILCSISFRFVTIWGL